MKYLNITVGVMVLVSGGEIFSVNAPCKKRAESKTQDLVVFEKNPEQMYRLPHLSKVKSAEFNFNATRMVTTAGVLAWGWDFQKEATLEHLLEHQRGKEPISAWFGEKTGSTFEEDIITATKGGGYWHWIISAERMYRKNKLREKKQLENTQNDQHSYSLTCKDNVVTVKNNGEAVSRIRHDQKVLWAKFNLDRTMVVVATSSENGGSGDDSKVYPLYVWRVARLKREIENEEYNKKLLARR